MEETAQTQAETIQPQVEPVQTQEVTQKEINMTKEEYDALQKEEVKQETLGEEKTAAPPPPTSLLDAKYENEALSAMTDVAGKIHKTQAFLVLYKEKNGNIGGSFTRHKGSSPDSISSLLMIAEKLLKDAFFNEGKVTEGRTQ